MPHDLWDDPGGYYKTVQREMIRKAVEDNIQAYGTTPSHGNCCWTRNVPPVAANPNSNPLGSLWLCLNQGGLEFLVDQYLHMINDGIPNAAYEQTIADQAEHVAEQYAIALEGNGTWDRPDQPPSSSTIRWIPPGGENTIVHGNDWNYPTYVCTRDTTTERHAIATGLIAAYMVDDIRARMTNPNSVLHAISLHTEWWCGLNLDGNEESPPRVGGRTGTRPERGWRTRDYYATGLAYRQWGQVRFFVYLFKLTGNRVWMDQMWDWLDHHIKADNRRDLTFGSEVFSSWDTGRKGQNLGGTQVNVAGPGDPVANFGDADIQFTTWNWYDGQAIVTLYYAIEEMENDDPGYWQSRITYAEDVILYMTKWGAWDYRNLTGPTGDRWTVELGPGVRVPTTVPGTELNYTGDGDLINVRVQGGLANTAASTDGYLLRSDVANVLTPSDWDALGNTTTYYPLFGMQHMNIDGKYYQYFWDPGTWVDPRGHHQKRWEPSLYANPASHPAFLNLLPQGPFGKNLSQDNMEIGSAMWIRYKILDKRAACSDFSEDRLWAEWIIHDSWAFLGSGPAQALRSKSQRATSMGWSTGGRATAWTLCVGRVAAGDVFGAGVKTLRYTGPTLPTGL